MNEALFLIDVTVDWVFISGLVSITALLTACLSWLASYRARIVKQAQDDRDRELQSKRVDEMAIQLNIAIGRLQEMNVMQKRLEYAEGRLDKLEDFVQNRIGDLQKHFDACFASVNKSLNDLTREMGNKKNREN